MSPPPSRVSPYTFLPVRPRFSTILCKFAHNFFLRMSLPWRVSPGAVRPPHPPSDATDCPDVLTYESYNKGMVVCFCTCVRSCVCESVLDLYICGMHGRISIKLNIITHYHVRMTLMTFSRSWVQRSSPGSGGYSNFVNSIAPTNTSYSLVTNSGFQGHGFKGQGHRNG